MQDLPTLYLQGGSIIPVGPPIQHIGEANPTDDLSLIIALDEYGNIFLNINFSMHQHLGSLFFSFSNVYFNFLFQ